MLSMLLASEHRNSRPDGAWNCCASHGQGFNKIRSACSSYSSTRVLSIPTTITIRGMTEMSPVASVSWKQPERACVSVPVLDANYDIMPGSPTGLTARGRHTPRFGWRSVLGNVGALIFRMETLIIKAPSLY